VIDLPDPIRKSRRLIQYRVGSSSVLTSVPAIRVRLPPDRQQLASGGKRAALEGQIATLRAELAAEQSTITRIRRKDREREAAVALDKAAMGRRPQHDTAKASGSVPGISPNTHEARQIRSN
jgi:hypothetical protein